ncbi:MAG: alpha/beta fold hydrolase [Bacteroidia bacterium]|nr:alpha/beta fold hydrolase [Bacteroidia bacterium]
MKLHYRQYGSGPALIILHGLYGSSDNWINIAKQLQEHYTVLLPDLRNHGASPHTPTHTYEEMANDLLQFYEETNTEDAYLIGHSMGGKVAMRFAAEHPEKVNRLMIIDIAPKNYLTGDRSFKHIRQHELILQLLDNPDLSKYQSRKELDDYFGSKIKEESLRMFLLKNIHRSHAGIFEWKINAEVLRDTFHSIVSEMDLSWFEERMPITAYPVTFVRGLNSEYVSDDDCKVIRKIYPEAKLVNFEGAGHWLHAEQPSKLVATILEKV